MSEAKPFIDDEKSLHSASDDRVPLYQKVAFGVGSLANQLFAAALGVFMVVLVMGLGMDPLLVGILGALPRLFDAITDPLMGYISDNFRSRWGRRRPFIFVGAVITGVVFMLMWQLYPENGQTYNFVYFLVLSLLFYLGYTIFATPLVALGYEMSPDFHERTRIMAVSQWIGQLAWVIAPWFWVMIYNPNLYESAAVGSRDLAIWVGLLCLLFGITPALFCKERVSVERDAEKVSIVGLGAIIVNFFKGIFQTFKCKPFVQLCGATFLVFNGFQTVAQFAFFIIVFYVFNGDQGAAGTWPAWFGTISSLCTCLLVIPIITKMSQKMGKKHAFIVATLISVIGYIMRWWAFEQSLNPETHWMMFVSLPLMAFGIGGLFTLMMSMTADVCDLDELHTGERREGVFGAVYWWFVKLGTAIATLVSGWVLSMIGYTRLEEIRNSLQAGEALLNMPEAVEIMNMMRVADITIPVVTAILAVVVMCRYDFSESRANEVRKELEQRRGKLS
ncbi:MFS transporter [Vibrio hippocampi]|uniref:Glucuronide carrier protein n=1 Tax=Vibrio hippocampi TaxID=654686 RepID=A0ABM8ZLN5_9VIBR|nr:MFS transporter [Vibrio hippocampi]CAH0529403.1 Glucuronide carrier protein [Vibrio hippocampi]